MKSLRNLVVICAALVLAGSAMAQGGGGRGQGRMGMFGGGDSSGLMLLQRADVQKARPQHPRDSASEHKARPRRSADLSRSALRPECIGWNGGHERRSPAHSHPTDGSRNI